MRRLTAVRAGLVVAALALAGCAAAQEEPRVSGEDGATGGPGQALQSEAPQATEPPLPYTRAAGVATDDDVQSTDDPLARWEGEDVPVEDVRIPSTADGTEQPALWFPAQDGAQPVLVVVHSWSTGYEQELNIPFALWAEQVGWNYVQPDFRGVMDDPDATGSDLAVQDVLDAVDYAVAEGDADPERVYVIGFSGGGMMSLLLAGRYPDRFAGAVSWVPIYDLTAWFGYHVELDDDQYTYAADIAASCGGNPAEDEDAAESCAARSPRTVLDVAREAGVPVYIGAGIGDEVVPPSDALLAYNHLAAQEDRLPEDVVEQVGAGSLPEDLEGTPGAQSWFTPEDPPVLLTLESGPVTAVIFDDGHRLVYYPGLDWIATLDAAS